MTIEANGEITTVEKFIQSNEILLGQRAINRIKALSYVGEMCIVYIYLSEIRIKLIK